MNILERSLVFFQVFFCLCAAARKDQDSNESIKRNPVAECDEESLCKLHTECEHALIKSSRNGNDPPKLISDHAWEKMDSACQKVFINTAMAHCTQIYLLIFKR